MKSKPKLLFFTHGTEPYGNYLHSCKNGAEHWKKSRTIIEMGD